MKRAAAPPHSREILWAGVGVGVLALLFYVLTLYPTISGGDSAEYVIAAKTLGVPHPSGYPLLVILGKLFTYLPFGSIACRVNLLSAVCDAAAAGLLTIVVAQWSASLWAGVFAGGLFAFSSGVWSYAVTIEAFALNNLFAVGLLYLCVEYARKPSAKLAYWGALLVGLSLTNHHTIVFYDIPFAAWIAYDARKRRGFSLLKAFGFFALGLLPYLYLPIAASQNPSWNWGDVSSAFGLFSHLLRFHTGTFHLRAGGLAGESSLITNTWLYVKDVPGQTLWIGGVLSLLGAAWALSRTSRAVWPGWVSASMLVTYLLIFNFLANSRFNDPLQLGEMARFWQQADVILFAWIGLGLGVCFRALGETAWRRWAVPILAIAAVLAQLALGYGSNDRHANRAFETYGRLLLEPLEKNSILIGTYDLATVAPAYLQSCELARPDVMILNHWLMTYWWFKPHALGRYPDLRFPGNYYLVGRDLGFKPQTLELEHYASGAYSMREFLDANYERFPIYVTLEFPPEEKAKIAEKYVLLPMGFAERILTRSDAAKVDRKAWAEQSARILDAFDASALRGYSERSWEFFLLRVYEQARREQASL